MSLALKVDFLCQQDSTTIKTGEGRDLNILVLEENSESTESPRGQEGLSLGASPGCPVVRGEMDEQCLPTQWGH